MDFSQQSFPGVAAVFPGKAPATSMSYHDGGKLLFVASEGDSRLQIIDCFNGKEDQVPLRIEREQIHVVEATYVKLNCLEMKRGPECRLTLSCLPCPNVPKASRTRCTGCRKGIHRSTTGNATRHKLLVFARQ
jgi:hypothetical protein